MGEGKSLQNVSKTTKVSAGMNFIKKIHKKNTLENCHS